MPLEYKFNEEELLKELTEYIQKAYGNHYAENGKIQAMELIASSGKGTAFALGNIIKYADRYGKKGDSVEAYRKDLMKIAHYAILALHSHDLENK